MLCLVAQSCLTLCDPIDCSLPGSSVHGDSPGKILEYFSCPPPEDLPNPWIKPTSPTLQADSLPAEPQRKPKNTGVGGPSLLQEIFPTQGSNPGLLHCRKILYQLSHKGSLEEMCTKIYTVVVCVCSGTILCPTLCNPMDYSPPGSSIHGIFQARILEWVAIPFSKGPF